MRSALVICTSNFTLTDIYHFFKELPNYTVDKRVFNYFQSPAPTYATYACHPTSPQHRH